MAYEYTPYRYLKGTSFPSTYDPMSYPALSNLPTSYGAGRENIGQNIFGRLGQATSAVANYQPEKINVPKAQVMPANYYQTQVEDLSRPLMQQYETSRAAARGNQAARGTLYDSEGYRDIGNLDKNFLEQLGSITRGVQLQRMGQEFQGEQSYADRLLQEEMDRRNLGFEGVGRAGQLFTQGALQQQGLDQNTVNALLGYGADRFRTETGLFGDLYQTDVGAEADRRKNLLGLLELQGYTGVPQEQLWRAMAGI